MPRPSSLATETARAHGRGRRLLAAATLLAAAALTTPTLPALADADTGIDARPSGTVRIEVAGPDVLTGEAQRRVAAMSLREKAAAVVMGHIAGTDHEALRAYMADTGIGGFILMGANIPGDEAQLQRETAALTIDPAFPPLIAIDQEGGDVSRLGAIGDSAGGNLVMQVAYKAASGTLAPTCAGELPDIAAVSVIYPAPDLASIYANDDPLFARFAQEFALDYIGGTPAQFPDRYAATNPAVSVTASAPPTLAAVGEHDHLVPTDGTLAVFDEIAAAGVPVEVVIVPFGEHAFDMHPGSVGVQVWHELTLRWFADHDAR